MLNSQSANVSTLKFISVPHNAVDKITYFGDARIYTFMHASIVNTLLLYGRRLPYVPPTSTASARVR